MNNHSIIIKDILNSPHLEHLIEDRASVRKSSKSINSDFKDRLGRGIKNLLKDNGVVFGGGFNYEDMLEKNGFVKEKDLIRSRDFVESYVRENRK